MVILMVIIKLMVKTNHNGKKNSKSNGTCKTKDNKTNGNGNVSIQHSLTEHLMELSVEIYKIVLLKQFPWKLDFSNPLS